MAIHFPPRTQQNRCIHVESMVWLHMHQERSQTIGLRKLNFVCSVKEKLSKTILKNGMNKQVENQTFISKNLQMFE